jgi:hypothetical protein
VRRKVKKIGSKLRVSQSPDSKQAASYATWVHISTHSVVLQVLSDGHVYFTNEGQQRPSAEAALQYPFLAPAFNPNLTPEELAEGTTSGSRSSWLGLFSLVQNRVTDLEQEISETVRQESQSVSCSCQRFAREDGAHGAGDTITGH